MLSPVFDEFVEASPVTVMMRGLMEEIFNSSRMNQLLETYSERQYSQEILFSTQVERRVRRSSSISPVAKILLKLLLEAEQWLVNCERFAPNAPQQNPVEDIWLQAKRLIREFYFFCYSFSVIKGLFEFAIDGQIFDFPKLDEYGIFSRMT